MSHALGEGIFNYEYSWRTNSDIIGLWLGCLARAGVEKWDIIRLTHNIFDPCWLIGLEIVVANIDIRLQIPLLEAYMEYEVNSPELDRSLRCSCLVIIDNVHFFREWLRMECSINFLLRWRGIIEDPSRDWLTNYLRAYDAYIHPNVDLTNLDDVEFYLPHYDKTSKGRSTYEFPLGSKATTLHEATKIIMIFKKTW